jgi:magnesium transporter
MVEIIGGLGPNERRRVAELRAAGRFFWVDATSGSVERQALRDALSVDDGALVTLLDFDPRTPPSRRVHIDGKHVVFAMTCFVEERDHEPIDVRVLIHGDYLLTIHEGRVSLTEMLDVKMPEGRSERYVVYAVLDAMVATAYDALNEVELAIQELSLAAATMRTAHLRMATLRRISARRTEMRRLLGPQRGLFERISEEIGRVEGLESDSEQYFERIRDQIGRLVDAIDAAGDALAKLIDLRLNEVIYRLTVVATVFLPLTFIVGFFGMNFGWMVSHIDTFLAFILLGVGLPVLLVAGGWIVVQLRAQWGDGGVDERATG